MSVAAPSAAEAVDRHAELTYQAFMAAYLRPMKPVIISYALHNWRALNKWTPKFFRTNYADKPLPIDGKTYHFANFIDLVELSTSARPAPYLFALLIDEHFPELLPDISPWPAYLTPNWLDRPRIPGGVGRQLYADRRPALFIGGRGGFCN